MPNVAKIMLAVFGGIGLVFGAIAANLFVDARKFAATAEHAEGVVTNLVYGSAGRSLAAFPVIRFQAPDGVVEFQSSSGAYPPSYRVGDKVAILYRPENPRIARVDSFAGLYLGATIFGCLGVAFGGVTGGVFLVARRAMRRGGILFVVRRATRR